MDYQTLAVNPNSDEKLVIIKVKNVKIENIKLFSKEDFSESEIMEKRLRLKKRNKLKNKEKVKKQKKSNFEKRIEEQKNVAIENYTVVKSNKNHKKRVGRPQKNMTAIDVMQEMIYSSKCSFVEKGIECNKTRTSNLILCFTCQKAFCPKHSDPAVHSCPDYENQKDEREACLVKMRSDRIATTDVTVDQDDNIVTLQEGTEIDSSKYTTKKMALNHDGEYVDCQFETRSEVCTKTLHKRFFIRCKFCQKWLCVYHHMPKSHSCQNYEEFEKWRGLHSMTFGKNKQKLLNTIQEKLVGGMEKVCFEMDKIDPNHEFKDISQKLKMDKFNKKPAKMEFTD